MTEFCMELDNETNSSVTLCLFVDVENADEVYKKVMSGELSCSMIKPVLIADPLQVVIAANKAALNQKNNTLTTRNLNTEILFCLSLSKNISRSLSEFGIKTDDKNILVAIVHKTVDKNTTVEAVISSIKGEKVPISRLSELSDLNLIKKYYKINDEELKISSLVDSIISRMCIKDFASLK